jgi:hypothetical protein
MTILTFDLTPVNLQSYPPSPLVEAEDYRPTAGPDPEPSFLDQAEWLGMSLALAGEPMGELVGTNSTALLLRFAIGQFLGLEIFQDERDADLERIEWEAQRLDDAFADPSEAIQEAERCGVC